MISRAFFFQFTPLDFYQIGASFSPLQVNPPSLLLLPLLRYLPLLSLSLILFLLPLSLWDLLRLLRLRLLVLYQLLPVCLPVTLSLLLLLPCWLISQRPTLRRLLHHLSLLPRQTSLLPRRLAFPKPAALALPHLLTSVVPPSANCF